MHCRLLFQEGFSSEHDSFSLVPHLLPSMRWPRPLVTTPMNTSLDALLERMNVLEKEILHELQRKEAEFFYEVRQGKVRLLLINASWR